MTKSRLAMSHTYMVMWGNPYTEPPEGYERVQQHVTQSHTRSVPPELQRKVLELGELHGEKKPVPILGKPGHKRLALLNPWTISTSANMPKKRVVPLSTKHRMRRKRLWKRLQAKQPLFAEQLYIEEVEKRRDYFGVHTKKIPMPPTLGQPTAHQGTRLTESAW